MATKIAIKNQILTSFGGIFYIADEYRRLFFHMIDRSLGLRSKFTGYQYSEILSALTMVYFCGGDHLEDITRLGADLRLHPHSHIPVESSSDVVTITGYGSSTLIKLSNCFFPSLSSPTILVT